MCFCSLSPQGCRWTSKTRDGRVRVFRQRALYLLHLCNVRNVSRDFSSLSQLLPAGEKRERPKEDLQSEAQSNILICPFLCKQLKEINISACRHDYSVAAEQCVHSIKYYLLPQHGYANVLAEQLAAEQSETFVKQSWSWNKVKRHGECFNELHCDWSDVSL